MKFTGAQLLLCKIVIRLQRELEREYAAAFAAAGWWMEGGEA